jgi:hypothetical protein
MITGNKSSPHNGKNDEGDHPITMTNDHVKRFFWTPSFDLGQVHKCQNQRALLQVPDLVLIRLSMVVTLNRRRVVNEINFFQHIH